MLEKSISSAATTLTCSRNGFAPDVCKQKLFITMKRSMGLASSDVSSSSSSKDTSPSERSDGGEESARKQIRAAEKTGSTSEGKRGGSTERLEPELVPAQAQTSTSASSSLTAPLLNARDSLTLTSQVQQLFSQSALLQPNPFHGVGVPWAPAHYHYANYGQSSVPFTAAHPAASHSYGQMLATQQAATSSTLLYPQAGVQPGAWGQVVYPAHYPMTHVHSATSNAVSARSYYSSSQSNAVSQPQKNSHIIFEDEDIAENQHDVTNQDSVLLSDSKSKQRSSQEMVYADRTETKSSMKVTRLDTNSSHAETAVIDSEADMSASSPKEAAVEMTSLEDYKTEGEHDLAGFISLLTLFVGLLALQSRLHTDTFRISTIGVF